MKKGPGGVGVKGGRVGGDGRRGPHGTLFIVTIRIDMNRLTKERKRERERESPCPEATSLSRASCVIDSHLHTIGQRKGPRRDGTHATTYARADRYIDSKTRSQIQ